MRVLSVRVPLSFLRVELLFSVRVPLSFLRVELVLSVRFPRPGRVLVWGDVCGWRELPRLLFTLPLGRVPLFLLFISGE